MNTYDLDKAIAQYIRRHKCGFKEAASAVITAVIAEHSMTLIKERMEQLSATADYQIREEVQ